MLALSTDYDCWRVDEEAVTVESIVEVLKANVARAQAIVVAAAARFAEAAPLPMRPRRRACHLHRARRDLRGGACPFRNSLWEVPVTTLDSQMHSLLVVGSVGLDDVETRAGKRTSVLGGAASYFSVAASFFAKPRMVAIVGADFPAAHTSLFEHHGVDLGGLERVPGETFRWSGVYAPDFSTRTTLDTRLNVFSTFNPKLPPGWGASEVVFLANIDPELQLRVLEQTDRPKFVACDTMNFWIGGKREPLLRLLRRIDMLLLNDEEARQLSGEANLPGRGARHPRHGSGRRDHQAWRRRGACCSTRPACSPPRRSPSRT